MRPVTFTYDPADPQPLPHARARRLMDLGRSVAIEGFTLGESAEDKAFLESLTGATFKGRVRFEGCTFMEPLDLAEATFEQTLRLVDCTFEKGLKLQDARVGGRCSLRGSTFRNVGNHWLNWRGLTTGGGLGLVCVTAHAPIDLYQARIGGDLQLDGVHVLSKGKTFGEVYANQPLEYIEKHHVAREMEGKALNLEGARVEGHVSATPFVFGSTDFSGQAATVLRMQLVCIMGAIDLRAKIAGQVVFNKATVEAEADKTAVQMESATVGGSVFFQSGTRMIGSIDLRARVDGGVQLDKATIVAGADKKAVDMERATVGGSVFIRKGTRVIGWIDLRAKVTGGVEFDNATVEARADKEAVLMDAATVGGSVFFQNGTRVIGSIDLRAKVGGQVAFNNATVVAWADKAAVLMESATVGGSVFMRGGTAIAGGVSMCMATLHGGLCIAKNANRSDFRRPRDPDQSHRVQRECLIAGDLDLRFVESGTSVVLHGVSVLGTLRARHLSVKGDLNICGGAAGTVGEDSMRRAIRWIPNEGRLNGFTARITHLRDSRKIEFGRFDVLSERVNRARKNLEQKWGAISDDHRWQPWERNSTSKDPNQTAIDLELAHVRGHLWIRGQRVLGGVKANLAHVEGDASFDRSLIEGDLDLRGARVEGAFGGEPAATGEPGPLVRGVIDASGGTFESVTIRLGDTPNTYGTVTKWYLFDSAKVGVFRVLGRLDALGRKVFSVHRMGFQDLELDGLTGGGYPWWTQRDEWRVGLAIALACASITAIILGCWPPGFVYVLIGVAAYLAIAGLILYSSMSVRRGSPSRRHLDFFGRSRFSAAFYIDAERWARAGGDDPRADEIFLERRRRELRERRPGLDANNEPAETGDDPGFQWFTKLWRRSVLDFMLGYGVRPGRAIHLFVLIWLLNWAVFLPHTSMESTTSVRGSDSRELATNPSPREWGSQRAFFTAMRLQVPFVDLFIDAEWKPADRPMFGAGVEGRGIALTYENWAAIMRILNLILVPVIIAGATGLLKPREGRYTGAA